MDESPHSRIDTKILISVGSGCAMHEHELIHHHGSRHVCARVTRGKFARNITFSEEHATQKVQ